MPRSEVALTDGPARVRGQRLGITVELGPEIMARSGGTRSKVSIEVTARAESQRSWVKSEVTVRSGLTAQES